MGLKAGVELGLHLRGAAVGSHQRKDGIHTVVGLALEILYLALTLYNQSDGHTLHTSGRECRLHLAPEHRRELETHQTVEHTACLLCIDQVHIQMTGMLYGIEDSGLGDLVEHDAVGLLLIQAQHLAQVPADGFSLAVFIGSQPHLLGLLGIAAQLGNQFFLLVGYVGIYTDFFLLQVAYMPIARHHFVVLSQEFLNGLGLCWALYDN